MRLYLWLFSSRRRGILPPWTELMAWQILFALLYFLHPMSAYARPVDAGRISKRLNCSGPDWDLSSETWVTSGAAAFMYTYLESRNDTNLFSGLKSDYLPQNTDYDCTMDIGCQVPDCSGGCPSVSCGSRLLRPIAEHLVIRIRGYPGRETSIFCAAVDLKIY
jgi:hypothetical protein